MGGIQVYDFHSHGECNRSQTLHNTYKRYSVSKKKNIQTLLASKENGLLFVFRLSKRRFGLLVHNLRYIEYPLRTLKLEVG